ncbi:retinol dehydrogenase 16-like [Littorina saxatilis]|uniref:Uncharacterized protein n=1 Tax=Littorina saxatilis TaxID=31220 RepID=A0AAN9BS77_9CAEN
MLWTLVTLFALYKLITWALSRVRVGDYDSKYVFITGCDSGFGNLLTKRLDGLGFSVFAACLTSAGAEKLQGACSKRVTTLVLDVTDEKSIAASRQFVGSRLPRGRGLWGLVNNAGIGGTPTPLEWMTNDDWTKVLSINLMGVIYVTRAFLPLVREAHGRVVNTASTLGRIALPPAPYCVSKYGVEAFSDSLRREVYNQGIKVCILEPGYFKTDILSSTTLVNNFKKRYDTTPLELRQHYPEYDVQTFAKLIEGVRERSSDNLHLVVDAYELALTSRFPPTRQLVGYDVRFFYRLLWNLPAPLADWLINLIRTKMM